MREPCEALPCWASARLVAPRHPGLLARPALTRLRTQVREAKAAEKEFASECERLEREYSEERRALKVRGGRLRAQGGGCSWAPARAPTSMPGSCLCHRPS